MVEGQQILNNRTAVQHMKQVTHSVWQIKQVRQNLSTSSSTVPNHNPLLICIQHSERLSLVLASQTCKAAGRGQRQSLQALVPHSLQPA